jgi:hypothetical protein
LIVAELKNPAAVEPLEADSMETKLHPEAGGQGDCFRTSSRFARCLVETST